MDVDLIELQLDVENYQEVIHTLGQKMLDNGYVKDTYIDAVLKREQSLPTGLDLGSIGVAIPHTDEGLHVNLSHIAVGVLKHPVKFGSMVDPQEKLNVYIVLLLAVKDQNIQIRLLKKLMTVFQNVELLKKIQTADTKEKVKKLLDSMLLPELN